MPVAQSRGHAGKALLIASVSVVLLLGLAFGVATLASRGDVEINLGDDRFDAGRTDDMAQRIEDDDGLPFLYQDLARRSERPIYVQHLGRRDSQGWVTFDAFDPDDPDCLIDIDRERRRLVDLCDPDTTYPLDGTGLRYYPVEIEDDHIIVDINEITTTTHASRATTSTTG